MDGPVVALDPSREEAALSDDEPGFGRPAEDPERHSARRELARLLEDAIDALPEPFRRVYVLREVEGTNTLETAEILGIEAATVMTRLHRARGLLRERLIHEFDGAVVDAFPFGAHRCDRLVAEVFALLRR